jgi:myosin-3
VATYFRYSLMDLLSKMVAGAPHFVRCIRPNKDKIPGYFDAETVGVQLKYTGVLETTKIRRLGYSHRISYGDFVKRYSILVYPLKANMSSTKETCVDIMQKLGLRNWKVGKTKLFLKYYHAEQLSRLYEDINHKIILIQCAVRRWLARKAYKIQRQRMTDSAIVIQRFFRGYRVRKLNKELRECKSKAASLLQAQIRGYLARLKYNKKKSMSGKNMSDDKGYEKILNAVRIIQSQWRGYSMRKLYRDLKLDRATKSMQFGYFCQQVCVFVCFKHLPFFIEMIFK